MSVAPSPQDHRRQRTRAALLAAGEALLAARPIDAISVNDVVEAAGVAKGSFFNHFEDKAAFAEAIAAAIREEMEARVTAANEGVRDPALRVARGVCGFVQFALTEEKRARIMLRNHHGATAGEHPLNRGIARDIAMGLESGRFAARAGEGGVPFVIGACQILLMDVLTRRATPARARVAAAEMLTLVLEGLGAKNAAAVADEAVQAVIVGKRG